MWPHLCLLQPIVWVVFGKQVGRTMTVCIDTDCPVHNPRIAAQHAADPPPTMEPAPEGEPGEAEMGNADDEQHRTEYEPERQRLTANVHSRMPVIVHLRDYDRSLKRGKIEQPPLHLLWRFPAEEMQAEPANQAVGNPQNNGPEMLTWTC